MSKKPMYLKRKASSKILVLLIVLAFLAILHLVVLHLLAKNEEEKVIEQEEPAKEEVILQSEFKGRVEEIVAPKSQIKAYYMQLKSNLVALSFMFDQAGYAYTPQGKEGLAQIAAATLKEGAGWWTAK